jgi:hypothetical protein
VVRDDALPGTREADQRDDERGIAFLHRGPRVRPPRGFVSLR